LDSIPSRLSNCNLFIADDVGLGKTIEAGLIARELLLRRKVSYIVVVCPPSVLLQWKDELETRFGLVFEILDRAYFARVRQERGYGVNNMGPHHRFSAVAILRSRYRKIISRIIFSSFSALLSVL
jgi:SNF2 family DNA or RNA helicase